MLRLMVARLYTHVHLHALLVIGMVWNGEQQRSRQPQKWSYLTAV
jgi:hypothetical protein